MAIEDDVQACLGADIARYFANKHRGGSSGERGKRYEDHFAVWLLAEAAVASLDIPSSCDLHISSQVPGFVDDLRVSCATSTRYYQLKNAETVSWSAGLHPIASDFAYQIVLSRHVVEPAPTTHLVLATEDLAVALRGNMPSGIAGHTTVIHFPWAETANRLVLTYLPMRSLLAQLAHVEDAPIDTLSGVFYALSAAFLESPNGDRVHDVLDRARRMFPGQIRMLSPQAGWVASLSPAFTAVLAGIRGLAYGAERGFFHWSGYGTQGVFPSDVTTGAFSDFQNSVIASHPSTFEAFEALLP